MKKLLIFLDELYFRDGGKYISNYAAGSFFSDIEGVMKTYLLPVSYNSADKPESYSVSINSENNEVVELPEWDSVISYLRKYILSGKVRHYLAQIARKSVSKNDVIWIRVPSLYGVRLAKEGIRQRKRVILHFAGDIEMAWKNNKYSGWTRLPAYLQSKYMHFQLLRLAKLPAVYSLCTGSVLYRTISGLNPNTRFFIDSNIKRSSLHGHPHDKTKKRFIYIGRLTEDKGILDLMEIFEKLGQDADKVRFTIIGFGKEESLIRSIIEQSDHREAYNFIGYVPNSEISTYLRENDYLVLPSKVSEGFPRVIIEAWAHGLLVLSTRVGGIDGLAVHNKNVIFNELGDLDQLAENIRSIIGDRIDTSLMQKNITGDRDNITYEYYRQIAEEAINGV